MTATAETVDRADQLPPGARSRNRRRRLRNTAKALGLAFIVVFNQNFEYALRNSLVVAGTTTLIAIPVAALAGYALARLRLRRRILLLAATLVATLFPRWPW